jgi:hypothetical protein
MQLGRVKRIGLGKRKYIPVPQKELAMHKKYALFF